MTNKTTSSSNSSWMSSQPESSPAVSFSGQAIGFMPDQSFQICHCCHMPDVINYEAPASTVISRAIVV